MPTLTKITLKQLLAHLDLHQLATAATHVTDAKSKEEQVDNVIDLIAAATPWSLLGPVGATIDSVEPGAVKAIAHVVLMIVGKRGKAA